MGCNSNFDGNIQSFQFTNSFLPASDRFDAWREYMISVADIEPLHPGRSSGLFSVETWNLGRIVVVNEKNPGAKFSRTLKKIRTATEDHYYLYMPRDGSNTINTCRGNGKQKHSRGIRRVAAFHSMVDVNHGVMENMDCLMVFLPRDLFGHMTSIMDRRTNENLVGPIGGLISDYIIRIADQLPKLTPLVGEAVSRSLVELVKAGFIQSDQKAYDVDPGILQMVVKSRIRTYINNKLHDKSLSIYSICNTMAISRASLYRLFEDEGGVMNYVLRRRMEAVLKEVQRCDQEKSLPDLAEAFGFKDVKELTRNYQRLSISFDDVHQNFSRRGRQKAELAHLSEALRSISSSASLSPLSAFKFKQS